MARPGKRILGFIVAPALPGVFLLAVGLCSGQANLFVGVGLVLLLTYLAAWMLGFPLHLLLDYLGQRSLAAYLAGAALTGPLYFFCVVGVVERPASLDDLLHNAWGPATLCIFPAAVVATAFWAIAVHPTVFGWRTDDRSVP